MRIIALAVGLVLAPTVSWAVLPGGITEREYDKFHETSDGKTAIRVKLSTDSLSVTNLTVTGTGERISGNTYGNYFDFNDEGNGVIAVSPTIALKNATAPASPTDTGTVGQVAFDGTYWYVCTATNTWMRTQLSTWAISRDLLMLEGIQLQLEGVDLQL
jgi:hypothetical protein